MQKKSGKIRKNKKGFTLIELIVAMFILVVVMGAMVGVIVSIFQSYQKSRAIKTVSEDVGVALNSIVKDIRMGNVASNSSTFPISDPTNSELIITRNGSKTTVKYQITAKKLILYTCTDSTCASFSTQDMVDLSSTTMNFDTTTSGFRNQKTVPPIRGWVEIHMNIENPSMTSDSIHAQTTISSRDYGLH